MLQPDCALAIIRRAEASVDENGKACPGTSWALVGRSPHLGHWFVGCLINRQRTEKYTSNKVKTSLGPSNLAALDLTVKSSDSF